MARAIVKLRKWILVATLLAAVCAGAGLALVTGMLSPSVLFNRVFAETGVAVRSDIAYGDHERQRLSLYEPAASPGMGPIVLFLYGGGWREGDRATYAFVGAALAARGFTTVIPDYRLFPEIRFPQFVRDAAAAYRWVAETLAGADGRQRPIVLMGHSAGAHIAALLAVDPAYLEAQGVPAPRALIGLAGPYSFDPTTFETTRDIFATVSEPDRARPTRLVTAEAPPTFLAHGLDDATVRIWNTKTFAAALETAGVPVRKSEYEGIGHVGIVLALSWPLRWRAPLFEEVMAFLETVASPDAMREMSRSR